MQESELQSTPPSGAKRLVRLSREALNIIAGLEPVLRHVPDAACLLEYRDGIYRYLLNNSAYQMLAGNHELEGLELSQVVGEKEAAALRPYYEECIRTGRPVRYEQEFSSMPGKCVLQSEVTPIAGKNGNHYLFCLSKDLSILKQAQRENESLSRRLRAMFSQHPVIQMIFEPDTGHIVDVNPAACAFFGYSRDEFLKMSIQGLNVQPSDLAEEQRQINEAGGFLLTSLPFQLKTGEIRILDIHSCLIVDEGRRLRYSIGFDATDRERLRDELTREKELLRITLQSIGDGVVATDKGGRITALNRVAQELTGCEQSVALGSPFGDILPLTNEITGQPVEGPIRAALKTGQIVGLTNHTELTSRHGVRIPIADSASPIIDEDGQVRGAVMVFRDMSTEKERRRQIEFLSYHDPLTGLYNRRGMSKALDDLDLKDNLPIAVVMGDVNGLKLTNDLFGHTAGDELLKNVADLLRGCCGAQSLIARWGGDEFVVFLPKTCIGMVEAVIERIRSAPLSINRGELYLSLSLGCAVKDKREKNIMAVLGEAEDYMYHQKLLSGKSYRNAIINTLLATLYEKSNETEAHSKRLEASCHVIGRKLHLSSKEMDELSLLALLHDIGKVSIDPDILQKPGPLAPAEWDEMKRHPEIGCRIARASPELSMIANLILSHHERWDGRGYPRGLKGEDIPLPCRILAMADALDAMVHDRAYRSAMSLPEAICELERNSGTQFDPTLVSILVNCLRERVEKSQSASV